MTEFTPHAHRVWTTIDARRRWSQRFGWIVLLLFLHALSAQAKLCGDNVGGVDVPCACGDMVASDVVLGDDPVTQTECAGIGLIVRARESKRGVVVDLHGARLRGNQIGAGLLVLDGGPGGARIVSTGGQARVENFFDGIVAHGQDSLGLVDRVTIVAPGRDGIRVGTSRYRIRNVEVENAGRNGFTLSGRKFRVQRTRSWNSKRYGYQVKGKKATLGAPGAGVVSLGSGATSFEVSGSGHRILDCVAEGGGKNGMRLHGIGYVVRGCRLKRNRGNGMSGLAMDSRMARNRAENNVMHGIAVRGRNVVDQGGNGGLGNLAAHGEPEAAQCKIGGQPCVP